MNAISSIQKELNSYFIERSEEIDCILTAVLSKQHCLFLGPPGTTKSYLITAFASHLKDVNYFQWLLTKFTTPEEVFGPYNLKLLMDGKYQRITTGKLPEAHIAFLDEIFKSSSAILNSLLTIINERIFYNDSIPAPVPLISLFSASNELPEEDEGLQALYDRLTIRKTVSYIKDYSNLEKLALLPAEYKPETMLSLSDLQQIQQEVQQVDVSSVISDVIELKRELEKEGVSVSDRRFRQCFDIIKAYTYMNNRDKAISDDLQILRYVFWTEPEEIAVVESKVLSIANPFAQKAQEFAEILEDIERQVQTFTELSQDVIEVYNKIVKIVKHIHDLIRAAETSNKSTRELEQVLQKAEAIKDGLARDILQLSPSE